MYIGIERAVVISDNATPRTVSRATIPGFMIVSVLYVFVSILPFGFMSQGELATLAPPSTAAILKRIVRTWGEVVINPGSDRTVDLMACLDATGCPIALGLCQGWHLPENLRQNQ